MTTSRMHRRKISSIFDRLHEVIALIGQKEEGLLDRGGQIAEDVRAGQIEHCTARPRTRARRSSLARKGLKKRSSCKEAFLKSSAFRRAPSPCGPRPAGAALCGITHVRSPPSVRSVPLPKAANRRSRGTPRSSASARRACPCRRPSASSKNDDEVGIADGADALRDDDGCRPLRARV